MHNGTIGVFWSRARQPSGLPSWLLYWPPDSIIILTNKADFCNKWSFFKLHRSSKQLTKKLINLLTYLLKKETEWAIKLKLYHAPRTNRRYMIWMAGHKVESFILITSYFL